jgi:hypothetical protein
MAVTAQASDGHRNCSTRFRTVDLRHASSGPVPVSSSRIRPIGNIHLLKNGGPTVRRCSLPRSASLNVGNIVANSTKNAENRRIQLFARNAASRETHESSACRERSSGNR